MSLILVVSMGLFQPGIATADPPPAAGSATTSPNIRLTRSTSAPAQVAVEVVGLDAAELSKLAKLSQNQWAQTFRITVAEVPGKEEQPAVLGSYRVEQGSIRFEPRYPLIAGVPYRAVLDYSQIPDQPKGRKSLSAELRIDRAISQETTVRQVYPTRGKLPENQLKFYLCFSAPMARGEAYTHVRLLDAAGNQVVLPFLELDQELWDPEYQRFTLLFDPGRIKRGLKSREEAGPALEAGKSYTFEVDRTWCDATGNPLKETFRKKFQATAPDDRPIDIKSWKLVPPTASTHRPFLVVFPKPLDYALLQRMIWIVDAEGRKVAGKVALADEETRWSFTPELPWRPGRYQLVIDTRLEDLAGNQVGKTFEIDVFHPVDREVKGETVQREFQIKE